MKLKIEDLCRESGLSRSTVYQFIRKGLLHPPEKVGFRSSFYDETHLRMLGRIRYLRKEEKLSFKEIKQTLFARPLTEESEPHDTLAKKKQIINKAMELFSLKGLRGTKITDITESLGIGKSTFYLYFKNKRELYLESIEHYTGGILIPKEKWNKILSEHDPLQRLHKRTEVFLEGFPTIMGIFNHVRHEMLSEDRDLVKKAKNTFRLLARPVVKDVRWGVKHGDFRPVNEELAGYFFLAMAEILAYRLALDDQFTLEEGIDELINLFSYGVLPQKK